MKHINEPVRPEVIDATESETWEQSEIEQEQWEKERRKKAKYKVAEIAPTQGRLVFFWFLMFLLAVIAAILSPIYAVSQLKAPERFIVIDSAGTFYVTTALEFKEARELHVQQAELATMAMLERNPEGLDYNELLQFIVLKPIREKWSKVQSLSDREFKSKQIHQKVEIDKINILETRDNVVFVSVTGQLIRAGIFEKKVFADAVPFKLQLTLKRNPDLTKNGRFPMAVADFIYEPAH